MSPQTVIATARVFRAEDPGDSRFYIQATMVSGVLRFEVVARLASGARGSVSGKEFFAAMMHHFGGRINIIEGDWNSTSELNDNLDRFNRALAAGLSFEDAAALTWTGLRASESGFGVVAAVQAKGPKGKCSAVRVQFSR